MKLSDAILKGSKGHRQTRHELRDYSGAVCALGAACYGVGISPRVGSSFSTKLVGVFPYLVRLTKGEKFVTLADKIIDKNDNKMWSFKRIASWLRKLGY